MWLVDGCVCVVGRGRLLLLVTRVKVRGRNGAAREHLFLHSAMEDVELAVGDIVETFGLQNGAYNDRRGVVTTSRTPQDRYGVKLQRSLSAPVADETISLRAGNLRRSPPATDALRGSGRVSHSLRAVDSWCIGAPAHTRSNLLPGLAARSRGSQLEHLQAFEAAQLI